MKIKKGKHPVIFKHDEYDRNQKQIFKNNNEHALKNNQHSQQPHRIKSKQPDPVVIVKKEKKEQAVLASQVSRELLRIQGSWPFDLAPDEFIIEEKRIILKRNYFPVGGSVITIPVNELITFEVNHAVIYSALYIKGGLNNTVNLVMQWLKPEDALRAKEVVDGLRYFLSFSYGIL